MSRFIVLIAAVALSASACGDTTVAPLPDRDPVSDVFSGTLTRNGGVTHSFITPSSGAITATLATLAPDNTLVVGLSLGTWNGSSCQVILANDKASQGSTVLGQTSGAGSLCVRVYDVGNVGENVTYDVQVIHP